ncbi:MAG: alpha/beta hydrolase [Thermodesulfobacteriota bacterium]
MKRIRIAFGILGFLTLILPAFASDPSEVGIVLMHGKQGLPGPVIGGLAGKLRSAGYAVSTPVMPWSRDRIYATTVDGAMREIDRTCDQLRKQGAKKIIVAGQSLGANAAIRYAATRKNINGLICLAPGHSPERPPMRDRRAKDVERAKQMVDEGNKSQAVQFTDGNMGRAFQIVVRPDVYLSWVDPEGPAVMPRNAASIKAPIPILFVVGSLDSFAPSKEYIFDKAPYHPKSRFVTVSADHLGVPSASIDVVLSWLESLSP